MLSTLILYRSLTQTQKASATLGQKGIKNRIVRTPGTIAGDGCSYCIRMEQRDLFRALEYLKRVDMSPNRLYVTAGNGNFEEVHL